jgi:pSer/pThr/pTyr-binding forkhead associated (FHA) protein
MNSPGNPPKSDDDDDLSALDALESDNPFGGPAATRVANVAAVSHQSGVSVDQARAKKLGISMASTLIEPLPPGQVVFVELPGGQPVMINKSVTVIGRAAGVADVVLDDDGASRQHAAILFAKGEFYLEDLQSSNGTVVGGKKVDLVKLAPDTEFKIGEHVLKFKTRAR